MVLYHITSYYHKNKTSKGFFQMLVVTGIPLEAI